MSTKFVSVNRNQPLWLPQYAPRRMLEMHCYAKGVFSSRRHDRPFKIEPADNVDLTTETVNLLLNKRQFEANLNALRAQDEALGHLLDTMDKDTRR